MGTVRNLGFDSGPPRARRNVLSFRSNVLFQFVIFEFRVPSSRKTIAQVTQ